MMTNQGGGEQMNQEQNQDENDQSYLEQCMRKLDEMIANPKLATAENLTEIKTMLEQHESNMNGQEETEYEKTEKEEKPSLMIAIGKSVGKKVALLLMFLFGILSPAISGDYTREDWQKTPSNLYRSTQIVGIGAYRLQVISTYSAVIGSIYVSSASGNAWIELYNSSTTNCFINPLLWKNKISISGLTAISYPNIDAYFEKGIVIYNSTNTAKFLMMYKEK